MVIVTSDDVVMRARALVLHDLEATGVADPATVSVLESALADRGWWLEQWAEGRDFVVGLVAQDVQDALLRDQRPLAAVPRLRPARAARALRPPRPRRPGARPGSASSPPRCTVGTGGRPAGRPASRGQRRCSGRSTGTQRV